MYEEKETQCKNTASNKRSNKKNLENGNLSFQNHHRRIEIAKLSIDNDFLNGFMDNFFMDKDPLCITLVEFLKTCLCYVLVIWSDFVSLQNNSIFTCVKSPLKDKFALQSKLALIIISRRRVWKFIVLTALHEPLFFLYLKFTITYNSTTQK